MVHKRFPPAPLWLTLGGIIPFVSSLIALWVWRDEGARLLTAALWLHVYAAMILSFLGGVRWGVEIARHGVPRWGVLGLSVSGALAGWGLVMAAFNPVIRAWMLGVMAALFGLCFIFDRYASDLPGWYRALRLWPSLAAILCLLSGAGLLLRYEYIGIP